MIGLTTDRLEFRQWQTTDFPAIAQFFADPILAQYVGGVKNKEEAWRLMATYIGHYQLKGYSYLALVEKATGALVGTVGLWKSDPWPEIEMGYWLLGSMQGKGYGTEAGAVVKKYAFSTLKLSTLVSYIHPDNEPSKQLATRLGGVHKEDIELLEFGFHNVFRYHPI